MKSGGRHLRAGAALVAIVFAVVVTTAGPAGAHANLASAQPPAGVSVPQAPGAVVLRFSEPLNHALSTIEVSGPSGNATTTGLR
ncbi:MAG: copper resistance protein CopC [Actinobacteria bacterium]|nr:MAG: copper resistance protein CopC [Actinomycetota bacterium]